MRRELSTRTSRPNNVIINPATLEVKVTDFSISVRVKKGAMVAANTGYLEGTLFYMSPEQTGRMNRLMDYRTDYYSLGVMFYQMFTGKLPFESDDPLEMIHFHIAQNPKSLCEVDKSIPEAVCQI